MLIFGNVLAMMAGMVDVASIMTFRIATTHVTGAAFVRYSGWGGRRVESRSCPLCRFMHTFWTWRVPKNGFESKEFRKKKLCEGEVGEKLLFFGAVARQGWAFFLYVIHLVFF